MRRIVLGFAVPIALLLVLLVPGSASAFPLDGCTLSITSLDAHGATLATATGGGNDSTQDNPFIVDWDGTVSYQGTTGTQVIKDNAWHVDVFNIPTPLRGGSPNGDGNKTGSGSVGVSANAPFRITGLYYVSGEIKGTGGSCSGSGWFKLAGDPVGTIPFFVGLVALVLGIVLVALAIGGSAIAGLIGGVLVGLGLAVELAIFSVAPLGAATPLAVLGLGLVGGIALIFVGRARGGSASPI